MKIQFDAHQDFQARAIQSVVSVFDGTPHYREDRALGDEIVPNLPSFIELDEAALFDNVRRLQEENGIELSFEDELRGEITVDEGPGLPKIAEGAVRVPHFSIEMETGTGKTYVYLRTIYELRQAYGFGKFIIVVPSIAIYEGVVKNFEITNDHFKALYGNETVNVIPYEGSQQTIVRNFATSTFCEVMVMTLSAFNKASNKIYKPVESGFERLPFEFIREARPILILDEPQNMESDKSRQALRTLNPLFCLRYSATHRSPYNLLYRLSPFEAFEQRLVKRIKVKGVTQSGNFNEPLLRLEGITRQAGGLRATVTTYVRQQGGNAQEATITIKAGDDLRQKTRREQMDGFEVSEVNAGTADTGGHPFVDFTNGVRLTQDGALGLSRPDIFRTQIRETIRSHMEAQRHLKTDGIKVLSLFFIDRVANYRSDGGKEPPMLRALFDEEFEKAKADFPEWKGIPAADVQAAYFAQTRKSGAVEEIETRDIEEEKKTADERKAEREAFMLIMKDKERLLAFAEPVCFLFAHSALKEGWDNPNVFQICTLNQTKSEPKKRQEIGRGLRLCVDQSGQRVHGDEINVLTVVANESYQTYVARLQNNYEQDGFSKAPPRPSNADRPSTHRNDKIFHEAPGFRRLWTALSQRVTYSYNLKTKEFAERCAKTLSRHPFSLPLIVVESGDFMMTHIEIHLEGIVEGGVRTRSGRKLDSHMAARLRFEARNTRGDERLWTMDLREGDDLAKRLKDTAFKGMRLTKIEDDKVHFGDVILDANSPLTFDTGAGVEVQETSRQSPQATYAVPDFLTRAAAETGLTRTTVFAIWQQMSDDKKRYLLLNPESFICEWISVVKNALADHVSERIEFEPQKGGKAPDLEELFPKEKSFPQQELIESGERGLYDQVQIDSEVERHFVSILKKDSSGIEFYFKFPPAFKVALPKIIGNYNPDWGIARLDGKGKTSILYIHETKGNENIAALRFPHEKRKIKCAQKYFEALEIQYGMSDGHRTDWWLAHQDEGLWQGSD